jgi:branched-chain amino acid transport system ATP-binding protein
LLERPDILRAVFLQGAAAGEELATSARRGTNGAVSKATARRQAEKRAADLQDAPVVLETDSLTKRFGGVTAVDGVTCELHQGEILGFIGPNGAGKTSLFDLVSGFSLADTGHVRFKSMDVTGWPAHERAHHGLGRSFQDARLWPELTVAECLAVALHAEGETEAALPALLGAPRVASSELMIHKRVDELVDLMGLGAFRNKFVAELSTGSRRIVELACMLAHRPLVLLLDEPSSGIAQRETEALGPLIRRIRDQLECSILIIEHDIPLITGLADHLVGLDLGRVVAYGRPAEVLSDPHVVESYLGAAAEKLNSDIDQPMTPAGGSPSFRRTDATAPSARRRIGVSTPPVRRQRPLRAGEVDAERPSRPPKAADHEALLAYDASIATDVRQSMAASRQRRSVRSSERAVEDAEDETPVAYSSRERSRETEG